MSASPLNARAELIQIAAVALAAAQCDEVGTTALDPSNEGVMGRAALERLLNEVREERRRQELKWGPRTSNPWLDILLEEVGEWAAELPDGTPGKQDAMVLGAHARARLEMR